MDNTEQSPFKFTGKSERDQGMGEHISHLFFFTEFQYGASQFLMGLSPTVKQQSPAGETCSRSGWGRTVRGICATHMLLLNLCGAQRFHSELQRTPSCSCISDSLQGKKYIQLYLGQLFTYSCQHRDSNHVFKEKKGVISQPT